MIFTPSAISFAIVFEEVDPPFALPLIYLPPSSATSDKSGEVDPSFYCSVALTCSGRRVACRSKLSQQAPLPGQPPLSSLLRTRESVSRVRAERSTTFRYGVGRGNGVGRGRGVTLGVPLGVAVGVTVGVAVGVTVVVGVGVTVAVAVGVGVGVGVAPAAQKISIEASGVPAVS